MQTGSSSLPLLRMTNLFHKPCMARLMVYCKYLMYIYNLFIHPMYGFLDILFTAFHSLLIILNLFGWIWKPTRRINFIALILTGGSWVLLGIFYGWGYCPLTDWHFKVLERLGETNLPNDYIKYLLDRITGFEFNAAFVRRMTLILFLLALGFSVYFNFFRKLTRSNK